MKKPRVFCLIPARGGSKGIVKKNLQKIGKISLLGRAIAVAQQSKICTDIVVSTDDHVIRKEAVRLKAQCPFIRPKFLATDNAPMYPVVRHALELMEKRCGQPYDYVLLLQPTCPFRTGQDVRNAFNALRDSSVDSLVSLCKIEDPHPQKAQRIQGERVYNFIRETKGVRLLRRQDAQPAFALNGAIYLSRRSVLQKSLLARDVLPYVMPADRSINIDSPLDLAFARFLVEKNKW